MEATNYQFRTFPWPPPNDRQDRRFYLFGFDADNQPYIVRWCDSVAWNGWRAVSLDTKTYDSAEPVAHAIEGELGTVRDPGRIGAGRFRLSAQLGPERFGYFGAEGHGLGSLVDAYDDLASMLYRRSLISFDEFLAAQEAFALADARAA